MYYHNRIIWGGQYIVCMEVTSRLPRPPQAYGQNAKHAASDLDLGKEVTV